MIQEIYRKGLEPVGIVRRIIDDLKAGKPKTGVTSRCRANWVTNTRSDSGWESEFKQPPPAPAGSRFAGGVIETSKAAARREKKAVSLMIQAAIDGEWRAVGADKENGLQSIAPILWTRFKHDQAKIETPCSVTLGQAEFFGVRFVRFEDLKPEELDLWNAKGQELSETNKNAPTPDVPSSMDASVSKRLKGMIKAYESVWAGVKKGDKLPANKQVAAILQDEYGISETLASHMASVLRPDWAKTSIKSEVAAKYSGPPPITKG